LLGEEVFKLEDWKVIGEYAYDDQGGRHQAFYSPVRDVRFKDIQFKAGERIQVEQSLKYSAEEASQLWRLSGLLETDRWSASSDAYSKCSCRYPVPSFCFFAPQITPSGMKPNKLRLRSGITSES